MPPSLILTRLGNGLSQTVSYAGKNWSGLGEACLGYRRLMQHQLLEVAGLDAGVDPQNALKPHSFKAALNSGVVLPLLGL